MLGHVRFGHARQIFSIAAVRLLRRRGLPDVVESVRMRPTPAPARQLRHPRPNRPLAAHPRPVTMKSGAFAGNMWESRFHRLYSLLRSPSADRKPLKAKRYAVHSRRAMSKKGNSRTVQDHSTSHHAIRPAARNCCRQSAIHSGEKTYSSSHPSSRLWPPHPALISFPARSNRRSHGYSF
jgi:hypothetical protein